MGLNLGCNLDVNLKEMCNLWVENKESKCLQICRDNCMEKYKICRDF